MPRWLVSVLLCCGALLLCIALANPFVNSAFNDDWAYSHTALRLFETGHFHYNGWGSPTIIFQSIWGALFIHLFGFSFNILRISALPFSLGFVALTYLLAIRLGLRQPLAFFCTLCLAVSPLALPSAASFMTEPFACCFSLLCVYAAVAALQTPTPGSAIRWLLLLTASGLLGGSTRQTVWLAPLSLLPYLCWIKRYDRRFVTMSVACFAVSLGSMYWVVANFSQKYKPLELSHSQLAALLLQNTLPAIHEMMSLFLGCLLMSLPVLLCFWTRWKLIPKWHLLGIGVTCLFLFDYLLSGLGVLWGTVPFIGNILMNRGLLDRWNPGLGYRPVLLHHLVTYPLTYLLLFTVVTYLYLLRPTLKQISWRALSPPLVVTLVFIFSYVPFLFPGTFVFAAFDRYMIPLLPVVFILIALPAQYWIRRVPLAAWLCLVVFAAYGTVTTHDYFRTLQARTDAAEQAVALGTPRTLISAGLEYDGWQALQRVGHTKSTLYGYKIEEDYNKFWFWFYTELKPDYVAISSVAALAPPSALVQVPFTAWTPPFRRTISVVRKEDIPKDQDY